MAQPRLSRRPLSRPFFLFKGPILKGSAVKSCQACPHRFPGAAQGRVRANGLPHPGAPNIRVATLAFEAAPQRPRCRPSAARARRDGDQRRQMRFPRAASAQPSFQPKSAFAYFLFVQRPTRNVCTVSMAVDRDRLQWAGSGCWPDGGNGRDSGRTRVAREGLVSAAEGPR
jgi:hypothetical protein